jgi:hypothetical protein
MKAFGKWILLVEQKDFSPPSSRLTTKITGVGWLHTKRQIGMNKKWHFWRWLALASILLGILLAMFLPTLNDSPFASDFEWRSILLRFFSVAPLCFFAFALLLVLVRFARPIFRWLFTWRTLKWFLRAFVVLMFLAALFYAEEDWRGKQDWENCKNELEAKGEKLDFASFIPPPVPDDQNFALTPIVASCYADRLHWSPNEDGPANTNLPTNRLEMKTYRADYNGSTNLHRGSWQRATFTDLKAWQAYYHVTAITNVIESFGW